jgi:hypothetical protein
MARFIGYVQGSKGEASRIGHERMIAQAQGWNTGGLVQCYIDDQGNDRVDFYATGGSSRSTKVLVSSLVIVDGKKYVINYVENKVTVWINGIGHHGERFDNPAF